MGSVLAIYDDGDLGVYRLKDANTKEDVDPEYYGTSGTSAGGEKMGETWTPLASLILDTLKRMGLENMVK